MLLLILTAGCTTTASHYAPGTSFTNQADIDALKAKYVSATSIAEYYSKPETTHRRNEFIAGRLVLYDLSYVDFVTRFRFGRAAESTILDTATLGVASAITLFGGERTKEVLGAIAGAIVGTRASYEKNFFDEQAAGAIAAQMNAERKAALVPIMAGTKAGVDEYPLSVALIDLANYQYAGTIDGALSSIQRDAGAKETRANAALDRYRSVTYASDASSDRIRSWLYPGFASFDEEGNRLDAQGNVIDSSARVELLEGELEKLGLDGLPIATFLTSPDLAGLRAKAIADLQIP